MRKALINLVSFCLTRRFYCKREMESVRKVYVRHLKDEDLMKVSFIYGNSSFPEREFNFMRSKAERLENALRRMKVRVEGTVLDSLRKKSKKRKDEFGEKVVIADVSFHVIRDGRAVEGDVLNSVAWTQGSQLVINDIPYEVIENAPEVSYLSLPRCIIAGFPIYPKICLEFSEIEDSDFLWYHCLSKGEKDKFADQSTIIFRKGTYFAKVHEGFIYVTRPSDIGRHLRLICTPKLGSKAGMVEEAISQNSVTNGPGICPFERRHEHTKNPTEPGCIRCVSYNILADLYADSVTARNDLFSHCPPEYLDYEYRKQLYLKEILGYNADLICLQEVDKKVFKNDLVPVLSAAGLEGVYSEKGGTVAEGLSCFYKKSKFRVLYSETVILCDSIKNDPLLHDIWCKVSENSKLTERILNRTTALQVVFMECLDVPGKKILVANTHLYFHPDSDNIRLIQASVCMRLLENMKIKFEDMDPVCTPVPLLFCGDFNSCPEFGVFRFVTNGTITAESDDWKSNPEETVEGMQIQHGLFLGSACGTPPYTNYTQGFSGCLDYIFYDRSYFKVKEVVPMPSHEEVMQHIALPNMLFPSDHIALVCTLMWT